MFHERFYQVFASLVIQDDLIIIDSPPILAIADARIIYQMSGVVLMVIKAVSHNKPGLEQSLKRFSQSSVAIRGFIFNDMLLLSSRYGCGHKYGKYVYQYSY